MDSVLNVVPPPKAPDRATGNRDQLMKLSRELETAFIAEMLKAAGVGKTRAAFGGGAGEDQFSGFLVNEYARSFANSGGLGLSEAIFRSLTAQTGEPT